jgi:aminotransferase
MRPSPIRKIYEKAITMEDVVFFCLGEPDFDTPVCAVDEAIASLRRGETHYTPNAGLPDLRRAAAENLAAYDGLSYDSDGEIAVTSGGMEGLTLALLTLCDPRDEVLLPDPSYTNYTDQIRICGAVPRYVSVSEEDGFRLRPEALEAAVTEKSKVLMLNTPCNPTGAVIPEGHLRELARIALEHDLYVIFDEVYKHLYYGDAPFFNIARIPGMRERTLIVDSCSKTYAMTGWRAGWIAGPRGIVSNIPKLQENVCSCVPAFVQRGAAAALRNCGDDAAAMCAEYRRRRDAAVSGVNAIEGLHAVTPEGAFYLFVNIRDTGLSSEEFATRLLDEARVALSPGSAFGKAGEGFVRISYATPIENIEKGLGRIAEWMKALRSGR